VAERAARWTRRRLIGAGGASAASVAGLAGLRAARPPAAAAQQGGRTPTNVLLIVVDGLRADFVGAYDDHDERADTPNLDALADESLRFEHAIPESMAPLPARKAIVTGMRSFPFRDWRPVEGMARFPGWTRVYDHQPAITDVLTDQGVEAVYIADNPLLEPERFSDVHRTPEGSAPQSTQAERWVAPVVPGGVSGDDRSIKRVVDGGIAALRELKGTSPFFLAVDAFDPAEASEPTPVFLRPSDALAQRERSEQRERETDDKVRFGRTQGVETDEADDRVRDHYAEEVTAVDREVGRLLSELDRQGLKDSTLVYFVSAGTTALGEHGVYGTTAAAGHEEVYKVAYMIRDPDGRRAGEHENFYASTHDVAPTILSHLGLTIPGKMDGEDLTAFFDDDDPPPRRHFTSCAGDQVIIGDRRYVLVSDFEGAEKRLYDTDPPKHEDLHGDEKDFSPRDESEDVSREEAEQVRMMWARVVQDAGGTMPKFGPDGPIRPREEADENDDDNVDEGILDRDDDLNFSGQ